MIVCQYRKGRKKRKVHANDKEKDDKGKKDEKGEKDEKGKKEKKNMRGGRGRGRGPVSFTACGLNLHVMVLESLIILHIHAGVRAKIYHIYKS